MESLLYTGSYYRHFHCIFLREKDFRLCYTENHTHHLFTVADVGQYQ
jgi:hypothetical protein